MSISDTLRPRFGADAEPIDAPESHPESQETTPILSGGPHPDAVVGDPPGTVRPPTERDQAIAPTRRERDPVYIVFMESTIEVVTGWPIEVRNDGEPEPTPLPPETEQRTVWEQIADGVHAKTDKAAIQWACEENGIGEAEQQKHRFWAPLAGAYRPRTPKVTLIPQTSWE